MTDIFDKQLQALIGNVDFDTGECETPIKDIEPLAPVVFEQTPTGNNPISDSNEDLNRDYEFVRSNLYALIGRSNAAIELVLKVANMTEGSSKSLEILATLIKNSNELSKDLIGLHKTLDKNIQPSGKKNAPVRNVQNNVYVQNTEEVKEASRIIDALDDSDDED